MISQTRERYFVLGALGVALILSLVLIQNFDNLYWLDIILATLSIGIVTMIVRWQWQDRPLYQPGYFPLFLLLGAFWLVVWFWYADDFCPDYWRTVLLNAVYCALLCTAFYWLDHWRPSMRPYVICLAVGLAVACVVLMWQGHCLIFRDFERKFEFGSYYFIPYITALLAAVLALLWLIVGRHVKPQLPRLWPWIKANWRPCLICFAIASAFVCFFVLSALSDQSPYSRPPSWQEVLYPALFMDLVGTVILSLIWFWIVRPVLSVLRSTKTASSTRAVKETLPPRPAGRLSLTDLLKAEASRTMQKDDLASKIKMLSVSESERSRIWKHVGRPDIRRQLRNTMTFSIGAKLPVYIDLFDFSSEVLEVVPQCRDKKYTIVGDELLIADAATRQVVAIVPA